MIVIMILCAVKMTHLWAGHTLVCHVCCQDDTSLGSILSRWTALAKMTHLLAGHTFGLSCVLSSCHNFGLQWMEELVTQKFLCKTA